MFPYATFQKKYIIISTSLQLSGLNHRNWNWMLLANTHSTIRVEGLHYIHAFHGSCSRFTLYTCIPRVVFKVYIIYMHSTGRVQGLHYIHAFDGSCSRFTLYTWIPRVVFKVYIIYIHMRTQRVVFKVYIINMHSTGRVQGLHYIHAFHGSCLRFTLYTCIPRVVFKVYIIYMHSTGRV